MGCDSDIVVQSKSGSLRVRPAEYQIKAVTLFIKSSSLDTVPCPITYSVLCIEGKARMQTQKCDEQPIIMQPSPLMQRGFIHPLGSTAAYPKKFEIGPTEIVTFPTYELPSFSGGEV